MNAQQSPSLSARWLAPVHRAWTLLAAASVLVTLASIPAYVALAGKLTAFEHLAHELLYPAELYSPSPGFELMMDIAIGAVSLTAAGLSLALALLIFRQQPRSRIAVLTSALLLIFAVGLAGPGEMLGGLRAEWLPWIMQAEGITWAAMLFVLLLFPDGHFTPRWTVWPALLLIPWSLSFAAADVAALSGPLTPAGAALAGWYVLPSLAAPLALVYRYRYAATPPQRQQIKTLVLGFTIWVLSATLFPLALLTLTPRALAEPASAPGPAWYVFVFAGRLTWWIGQLFVPLALTVAVLRNRLFNVELIFNRALVYGALSAVVVGLYVLVVGLLGAWLHVPGEAHATADLLVSLATTGLVAVLFHPLRDHLQRLVNRFLYGERDEPYAVLSRLSERLQAAISPERVTPTIVSTVADALRLPYVAIALNGPDGAEPALAAAHGQAPEGPLLELPVCHQSQTIGQLRLAPRAPGEGFTPAEQRLLAEIAQQAGAAIHSTRLTADLQRLTADLQRSREHLVLAREEERRQLRRDLHDDLAPTLAALALNAGALAELIPSDSAAATRQADELQAALRALVGDIRRLVYDLRPPTLDELGLVAAIRERAAQVSSRPGGPAVTVSAPERLPPLPAAVEVAAYRIAQEALANTVRHAHARSCVLRLWAEGLDQPDTPAVLCLEALDDGDGLPAQPRKGVGQVSMQERAAELGGSCVVARRPQGGTSVRARLPVRKDGTDGAAAHLDR